jgi:hypothetical protein
VDELAASSRSIRAIVGDIDRALAQFGRDTRGPEPAGSEAHAPALPASAQPLPLSLGITPVSAEEEEALEVELLEEIPLESGSGGAARAADRRGGDRRAPAPAEDIEELQSADDD